MSFPEIRLLDGQTEFPFATEVTDSDRWPALTGVVRPAAPADVAAFDARCREITASVGTTDPKLNRKRTGEDVAKLLHAERSAFFARHLVSWNVAGQPITPDTVGRLPAEVFGKLDPVVTGAGGLVLGNSAATSAS